MICMYVCATQKIYGMYVLFYTNLTLVLSDYQE